MNAYPDQLPAGALVRLKSGGPLMTVLRDTYSGEDRMVSCAWFEGAAEHRNEFPRPSIQPTPADQVLNEVARQIWEMAQSVRPLQTKLATAEDLLREVHDQGVDAFEKVRAHIEGA